MKDYSTMSDFEINKKVSEFFPSNEIFETSDGKLCYLVPNDCPAYSGIDYDEVDFDPCNSWADAGPIIVDYGIGIMPFKKGDAKAWDLKRGLIGDVEHQCPNVLRAAMIVFLIMKDAEK